MSEAHLAILRRLNEALNERRDWVSFYDPDAEFHMPAEWPEDPVYRGEAGLHELFRLWTESFDEYRWEEKRLIDAQDSVVGLYEQTGRIKGTETGIDQAIGVVFRFRKDKLIRVDASFSWDEALQLGGVAEPPGLVDRTTPK